MIPSPPNMTALQNYKKIETEIKSQQRLFVDMADKKLLQEILKCDIHQNKLSLNCRQCKRIRETQKQLDAQQTKHDCETTGIMERYYQIGERGDNIFPLSSDSPITGLNQMLRQNIQNCQFYRELVVRNYHDVVSEVEKSCSHSEPWAVGGQGVPSSIFCCLFKFMTMNLSVSQVKGLLEYRTNNIVRSCGFLYVRYVCDPNYLWAWMKRYILEEEEFHPCVDHSRAMTIGEYVEMLLTEQSYFNTLFPRIPMQINNKIQAQIVISREKRQRKLINMRIIDQFTNGLSVRAISKVDEEWHNGIVERFEGNLLLVKFIDQDKQGIEPINLGEVEIVAEDINKKLVQIVQERFQDVGFQIPKDLEERSRSRSRSRSLSRSRSRNKPGLRSKSRNRSSSRHKSRKHSEHKQKDKHKHKSKDKHKHKHRKSRSHSQSQYKHRTQKRSRSRSGPRINDVSRQQATKYESNKEKADRLEQEIRQKQKNRAVAENRADVARMPASYKSSLSGTLPTSTLSKPKGLSPSPIKEEKFVKLRGPPKQKLEQQAIITKADEPVTAKSMQFQQQLKSKYGDASSNNNKKSNFEPSEKLNQDYI